MPLFMLFDPNPTKIFSKNTNKNKDKQIQTVWSLRFVRKWKLKRKRQMSQFDTVSVI